MSEASKIVIATHNEDKVKEIKSREDFYKNMVWVVDGTRFKRDYPRFSKRVNEFRSSVVPGFFYLFFPKGWELHF